MRRWRGQPPSSEPPPSWRTAWGVVTTVVVTAETIVVTAETIAAEL